MNSSASLAHVLIRQVDAAGISLTSGTPSLRDVTITGARSYAITQELDTVPNYDGIAWSDNELGNHIRLDGGVLTEDRTWDFDGLPVHLTGDVTISQDADGNLATLTIVPGSIIKMPTGRFISANPGVLKAEGSASNPIVFTSINDDSIGGDSNGDGQTTAPARGDWESIYLWSGDSILQHTEVRYAGNSRNAGNPFGYVAAVDTNAAATLSNVTVSQSDDRGVSLKSGNPILRNVNVLGGRN